MNFRINSSVVLGEKKSPFDCFTCNDFSVELVLIGCKDVQMLFVVCFPVSCPSASLASYFLQKFGSQVHVQAVAAGFVRLPLILCH